MRFRLNLWKVRSAKVRSKKNTNARNAMKIGRMELILGPLYTVLNGFGFEVQPLFRRLGASTGINTKKRMPILFSSFFKYPNWFSVFETKGIVYIPRCNVVTWLKE